jgi:anti-sigma-K factor RskA
VTGRDRPATRRDCRVDAAPYVLGAHEPAEARAYVRHMASCAACREEVAALRAVLHALPGSAPARRVPRALRRRVLWAVRAESRSRVPRPRWAPSMSVAVGLAILAAVSGPFGSAGSRTRVIAATVGDARLRLTDGHGELIIEHLAPPPADRVYELWLQSGRRVLSPSTLFAVTPRGSADLGVPGDLHGVTRLLVTVEPRGGSLVPTTKAVIVERLT